MKKNFQIIIIIILAAAILLTNCTGNVKKYRSLKITVNDEAGVESEPLVKMIKAPLDLRHGTGTIEILIYSYSSGAEILEYNDEKGFKQHYANGTIKAMIKFKRSGQVNEIIFTSASGKSRDEIIRTLSENINSILSGRK